MPAFKPSAPAGGGVHMPGGMGGGVHMPGGMAGGAHLPGGMAGGAHLPGNMGGGAHLPGSMAGGAHLPGGMAGGAHAPENMARGAGGERREGATAERAGHAYEAPGAAHAMHAGYHGTAAGHPEARAGEREARAGEREAASRPGERAEHADPRIGGAAALHTRGLVTGAAVGVGAGLAAHHMAASFMSRPAERDIGRDRAFVSMHAADFHARFVRDFSPAEFARWRVGVWSVGWHFGRLGWWWDVGGVWYPYAVPVYPYPLEVAALTVYGADTVDMGYPVADAPAIPPLPAAPAGLYSCASPQGYFPAVQTCGQPWQLAEAPEQAASAPPPAAQ